jgi:hypothetical protein
MSLLLACRGASWIWRLVLPQEIRRVPVSGYGVQWCGVCLHFVCTPEGQLAGVTQDREHPKSSPAAYWPPRQLGREQLVETPVLEVA